MSQLPLFTPPSDWCVPSELPDLRGHKILALDIETKDDGIANARGSGWAYGSGYICGVTLASEDRSVYAPVRHPDTECLDPLRVKAWVADHLRCGATIVTQNGGYDYGWLGTEWGLPVPERRDDTLAMAVILNENRLAYNLDAICAWQGLPGKDERLLREATAAYGVPSAKTKEQLCRLPARYVGPYAEQDGTATLEAAARMRPQLEADDLMAAYRLEVDLVPMVLAMRRRGIRVDLDAAERARKHLQGRVTLLLNELSDKIAMGRRITVDDLNSPKFLERVFQSHGVNFPRTEKLRQGSFKKEWMERHEHWLPQGVARVGSMHDAAEKFIKGFIVDFTHRGRLHAEIHQLRSDDGGTRTLRFSYSDPPLQQMPAIDEEIAALVRGIFLPEPGEFWCAPDYNQQEFRMVVSDAIMMRIPGSEEAARYYREHDDADFHAMVAEITGLPRKKAKIQNFAIIYGQGVAATAEMLGISYEEAKAQRDQYYARLPWAPQLQKKCSSLAERRGYIRLIDGARCRFDMWEPRQWQAGTKWGALPIDQAKQKWPDQALRRAFTHKALNRRVQGSAARQMKMAMRVVWQMGVTPLLQMHDELDCSLATEQQGIRVSEAMRDVISLQVPVKVDLTWGRNWAEAKFGKRTWAQLTAA